MEAILGLGSNLGDRLGNLKRARSLLRQVCGKRESAASPIYETEPVGVPPRHAGRYFLNAVVAFKLQFSPAQWLAAIRWVEEQLGRRRGRERNAPRTIDVDLLLYGDRVIDNKEIRVPHPRLKERLFVLKPLADIRPELRLPGMRRSLSELLREMGPLQTIQLFAVEWEPEDPRDAR
ncbi:MAG TPA: 2-amino-4-hydroxy-6-hydroxymethyldihydropteridine diphosphokinase [Kiritimatiellae bacterium]|nr:2-amino-4-hydroxy-6-hydroxymethyldihydropteridine diphosphokinase [Kiritimatiellia bacterium]